MDKMINNKQLVSNVFRMRLPKPRSRTYVAQTDLDAPPKPQKIAKRQIPIVFAAVLSPEDLTIEKAIDYTWLVYHFCKGKRRWEPRKIFPKLRIENIPTMARMFAIQPTSMLTYSHAFVLFLRYVKCTFPKLKKIAQIGPKEVTSFLWFDAYRGLAPSTISLRLTAIKHFLTNLRHKQDPTLEYSVRAIRLLFARKVKKAYPLRLRHIARFMKVMDWSKPTDVRDAYLGYLVSAGWLRVSELVNLKWDDVFYEILKECPYGPEGTFLHVIDLTTTKTKAAGDVIVLAAPPHFPIIKLKKLIRKYREFFPDPPEELEYVFRAPRAPKEKQMSTDCARRIIKRIARRIGEKDWKLFSAHSGRVGGVTDAAEAGISEAFMRWFGRWETATFYGYFQDSAFAGIKTTLKIANHTLKVVENEKT